MFNLFDHANGESGTDWEFMRSGKFTQAYLIAERFFRAGPSVREIGKAEKAWRNGARRLSARIPSRIIGAGFFGRLSTTPAFFAGLAAPRMGTVESNTYRTFLEQAFGEGLLMQRSHRSRYCHRCFGDLCRTNPISLGGMTNFPIKLLGSKCMPDHASRISDDKITQNT